VSEAAAILARLDAIMAELAELRAKVVASLPAPAGEGNGLDADDFADGFLSRGGSRIRFWPPRTATGPNWPATLPLRRRAFLWSRSCAAPSAVRHKW
jgi:hypothetical protein